MLPQRMALGMLMRNSKLRTALYVIVAAGMCLTIYMLRSTHYQLNDIMNQYDACLQQKDSLLAQMQVVYEQKNRVEKYLQQERQEHKQTKAEHQKSNEMRLSTEKDKREVESKYLELQKEHQGLEEKREKLEAQLSRLQEAQNQKEDEKKHLQSELNAHFQEVQNTKNEEIDRLKGQINTLQVEKGKLQQQIQVQDWAFNQQITKLQFCQAKQSELEKQLSISHTNITSDSVSRPSVIQSPNKDRNKPSDEHIKDVQKSEKASNDGAGINNVEPSSPNNNEPLSAPKLARLPTVGDGDRSSPKLGGGDHGAGGGVQSLPEAHAGNPVATNPPLKLPQTERDAKQTPNDETPRNPGGLMEQIQPPNADVAGDKKFELDKNADDQDLRRVVPDAKEMVKREDTDQKYNGFLIPEPMEQPRHPAPAVENNLARPNVDNAGAMLQQPFRAVIKRGPQPDHHNQGHLNQFEEDNNYVDEGDDDNAEEQDGDNDHIMGNKKSLVRDQDFDDQDNGEGMDNHAKEGVMVAPK